MVKLSHRKFPSSLFIIESLARGPLIGRSMHKAYRTALFLQVPSLHSKLVYQIRRRYKIRPQ